MGILTTGALSTLQQPLSYYLAPNDSTILRHIYFLPEKRFICRNIIVGKDILMAIGIEKADQGKIATATAGVEEQNAKQNI